MKQQSYFCNCLYFSSGVLARKLNRIAEEAFRPAGMSPSYAFVLLTVNRKPGISPTEIARELQLGPSTITRFLDKLQHRAYLTRETRGKQVHVYPTYKSQNINEKLQEAWETLYDSYHDQLGDERTEVLSELLTEAADKLNNRENNN